MFILKKALLLTSLMLGMLLFSAHTTDNIFDTITDDFAIVLDAPVQPFGGDGDSSNSEYRCDDGFRVLIGHNAGPALANYIRIVVTGANQTLEVRNITNPYMYLGIDSYHFSFDDLYRYLPPGIHEITFHVWVYSSNGSQRLFANKYVRSSCGASSGGGGGIVDH